ncbi:MAG: hypothetical protein LUH54_04500 [Firmicutes bacterium]|nr:hypothetical protein [Bacillota bacterium]
MTRKIKKAALILALAMLCVFAASCVEDIDDIAIESGNWTGEKTECSYSIYVPASDGYAEYTYSYMGVGSGSLDASAETILNRIFTLGELDGSVKIAKSGWNLGEDSDDGLNVWTIELTGDGLDDDVLKCVVNTLLNISKYLTESYRIVLTVNGEPAVIDGVTCPEEGFEYFDLDVVSSEEIAE